ncbi:hypothetical protein AGMMS49525_05110 [Bacteroidia bacterium]|nr:hypothetical protein AGMMS49525_05110 [Bacteroidia bacterium]
MGVGIPACSDMLDTDSDRYLKTGNNTLDSANDSLYSVLGILKQMQKLGENYVLIGELRGDLMDITENSDENLQELSNFNVRIGNPYASTKEYYQVINNCNYYIAHADTSIVAAGSKVLLQEFAVVKTLRAWTYLQLALNFDEVIYLTQPILTLEDMNKDYSATTYNMKQDGQMEALAYVLYQDLLPYINTPTPNYGKLGDVESTSMFIPTAELMAELALWGGSYELAAYIYYQFLYYGNSSYGYRSGGSFYNGWMNNTFDSGSFSWSSVFSREPLVSEVNTVMFYSSKDGDELKLVNYALPVLQKDLPFVYKIKPSQASMDLFETERFTYYDTQRKEIAYTWGDLRGKSVNFNRYMTFPTATGSYQYGFTVSADSVPYITKYNGCLSQTDFYLQTTLPIFRTQIAELRYAEALNWAGYPSIAFAILKYGLNLETLRDTTKVSAGEVGGWITEDGDYRISPPFFADWTDLRFSEGQPRKNIGVHYRGSGDSWADPVYFAFTQETLDENKHYPGFPNKPMDQFSKMDSVLFVDVMICKELALESAYEGNRFSDLMRFSDRRRHITGDDTFLPEWVGRRNPALKATLKDRNNWFLPASK